MKHQHYVVQLVTLTHTDYFKISNEVLPCLCFGQVFPFNVGDYYFIICLRRFYLSLSETPIPFLGCFMDCLAYPNPSVGHFSFQMKFISLYTGNTCSVQGRKALL